MTFATRLFVGNLPVNTQEKDLFTAFSAFGEISTLDLKSKTSTEDECKKFAFVSITASNDGIESCIKHFSDKDFMGYRLYVTRARESFLERLQRERAQTQKKETEKAEPQQNLPKQNPVIKLGDNLNPRKRKIDNVVNTRTNKFIKKENNLEVCAVDDIANTNNFNHVKETDKKGEAEKKRMESILKKRQEFKEKQKIIKTGLAGIDKQQNKKVIFNDDDDVSHEPAKSNSKINLKTEDFQKGSTNNLFDDDNEDTDDDLNFEIKKQFEGKKGQKVLDLQSTYKSDKRFTLDERFIDDEEENQKQSDNEEVEIVHADEKSKQLNILQNVLGITLKSRTPEDNKKVKSKPGMLRFDPQQPEHAKFLAPMETKPESSKKLKKKSKDKQEKINKSEPELDIPKVEVSKEQFYKVSETLKEAYAQPTTFSLRSLFGNNDNDDPQEKDDDYTTIETPKEKKKVKNPLDPTEKNPFVYDSSDSEIEVVEKEKQVELSSATETKALWKENLFFSKSDPRLQDGVAFFTKSPENEVHKERRELKTLVKKRIYNKDRKNQMFKKKIGGRKKSMKKPYKNKN